MPVTIGLAAAQTVTSLINSVNNISDTNKRRFYEQNLASLNYEQKEAIGKLLQKQTTDEAKMKVLSDTLGSLNMARINAITKVQVERDKTNKYLYISLVVGVVVIMGLSIYFYKKKKSNK